MAAATGSPKPEQSRENNFDVLRYVLAVMVIFSHSFAIVDGNTRREWLAALTNQQIGFGGLAVGFFFTISGFLITGSWLKSQSLADYFRKRILRIYPAFVLLSLVTILIIGPLAVHSIPPYLRHFNLLRFLVQSALLSPYSIPGLFEHAPLAGVINASIWTIRYEFICYIMVAGLGYMRLLTRRSILVLFCSIFGVYIIQTFSTWGALHGHELRYLGSIDHWPRLLTYFLAGSVFFLCKDKIPHSRRILVLALGLLTVALVLPTLGNLLLPLAGTYLLMHVAFARSIRLPNFARYGDFSYGVYLYAFPVAQLIVARWNGIGWPTLFICSLIVASAAAFVSWHAVERGYLEFARTSRQRLDKPVDTSVAYNPGSQFKSLPGAVRTSPRRESNKCFEPLTESRGEGSIVD